MKFVVVLLVLGLAVNAHALLGLNHVVLRSLLYRQLSLTCRCADRSRFCEVLKPRCSTSFGMRYTCPVTCGVCDACKPDSPPPTLIAPVSPCDFNCVDNFNKAVCEYFKNEGRCNFFKSKCRATCGECRQCKLPPDELPPCSKDCKDLRGKKTCEFWRGRRQCGNRDVRYVCQLTCAACTRCPIA